MSILKDTCSASELAELLQITERHVRRLASDGVVSRAARGSYWVKQSLNGYLNLLHVLIPNRSGASEGVKADLVIVLVNHTHLS